MLVSWLKSLAEQDATEQAFGAVVQGRSRKLLFKNRGPHSPSSLKFRGVAYPSPHLPGKACLARRLLILGQAFLVAFVDLD